MSHLSEFLEAQMVEEKHKNAYQFRQAFTAKNGHYRRTNGRIDVLPASCSGFQQNTNLNVFFPERQNFLSGIVPVPMRGCMPLVNTRCKNERSCPTPFKFPDPEMLYPSKDPKRIRNLLLRDGEQ